MLQIGQYHELKILRTTPPGLFLGDDEGNEVLLPNKYMPAQYEIGDVLEVFVYLDFEERIVATNIEPYIVLNHFAKLRVKDVTQVGAFLDWGLEKDLFVPFKEQLSKMKPGGEYLVYMYEDETTGRLVASQRVKKFLDNSTLEIKEGEEVDLIIANETDLGVNVIVNEKYLGLIYHDEIFTNLSQGDTCIGYVKKIREDNKLDISLQAQGYKHVEPNANMILEKLKSNNGKLMLSDKSQPEEVYKHLGMSKKTFKKAIGLLYKQKLIVLSEDSISLS
jgi:predicted RNA-binding protein (virulence factor B family)